MAGGKQLTDKGARAIKAAGKHGDGGGLYLVVETGGARRWVFIYQMDGRRREMGLGALDKVGVAAARDARDEAKKLLGQGVDPIAHRDAEKAAAAKRQVPTFGEYAPQVVDGFGLQNAVDAEQYKLLVSAGWAPGLQAMAVNTITTEDVKAALAPHWRRAPSRARRMRWLIERVLDSARVANPLAFAGAWALDGGNPARWVGHLKLTLPKVKRKTRHHPSLPHEEVGAFMARLRAEPGTLARALEFHVLTAARPGEVRALRWRHLDLDEAVWTVPDDEQKKDKEHRVPLSARAVALARTQMVEGETPSPDAFVFCNTYGAKHRMFAVSGLNKVVARLRAGITPHGFRSTFRNWGAKAGFERELLELCLSHAVGDETERSYWRDDMLDERRPIMDAWAARCLDPAADKVVPFRAAAAA